MYSTPAHSSQSFRSTGSFVQPELDAFTAYLSNGGRKLVMLDPTLGRTPGSGLVNTGLVRYVYYEYPLGGSFRHSFVSARAGRCANEQGKFWEYHDLVYARQQTWSPMDDGDDTTSPPGTETSPVMRAPDTRNVPSRWIAAPSA